MAEQTTYDSTTALVVVDVQNDFAHPDGNLYVSGGDAAIEAVNREIDAAHEAGSLVVYTQDWHPPSTPHFQKDGGTWPVHCVRDTWGAELHGALRVVDGPVVRKGTGGEDGYSGFSVRDPSSGKEDRTELEGLLRDRGVENVVVVGLAQDVCVKETVLDAQRLGFDAVVLTDATRPVDLQPGDGDRALSEMTAAGATVR
ncbi:isochorismatase family protein [Actinobacteria bacterium YIM 96077]|uniref:nicotinamidase n=1 Tax=Phytoactinopolyspora halophila TaxID=1981511 RepID=A0A329QQK3_9ACTN|nr:isochorismatase family protein [Phytoactinopolyspora halophila]AYY15033.1 isochorismatase family protein [Actinobacteria bacterium YIM 96077]RAW14201.1 isochorismatase [Phytoactinopolyspora halophila]